MANGWLLDQEIDLAQPVSRQYTSPYGIAMSGDDRAQRLRYTVYDGQDAADISGTVKVYYRRPDDSLIESTSGGDYVTVEDNTITAELPPEAYEQKGTVECLVKLYASDGKIVTLARCDIEVLRGVENDETIIPAGEASRASLEDRVAALEVATGVVPIDQLPDLPHTPQTGDYYEVEDGNGPYKIDYVALADAIIARAAANNLVTTVAGKLLDARQGKALNDNKLNKANVYNGLDKTAAGYALDARQGKALKDTTDALAASVSDVYDSTATYAVGDYCIHDDSLYKCITAIPTAEAWDATHWTAVTVTDAITQSTATVMGVDIPLVSNSVAINPGTVQAFSSGGIATYKFVDLYFEIQGGRTNAVRLWPNYTEKKYKFGFFAWNDTDNAMRRVAVTFTSAGRYMDQIAVKYSYNDDAFADASNVLYLVKAVGYAW